MNINTYKEYQKAFSEINFILNNSDTSITNNIPSQFMELIKNNVDKNYTIKFNLDDGLENCKLLDKTKDILSLIYRDYICNDEERDELINYWNSQKQSFNINEKLQNINSGNCLNNEKTSEKMSLEKVKQEKWYKKIINKIIEMFKK